MIVQVVVTGVRAPLRYMARFHLNGTNDKSVIIWNRKSLILKQLEYFQLGFLHGVFGLYGLYLERKKITQIQGVR